MNINNPTMMQKNGGIRLTIKSLLEKLVKLFIKPRRPKQPRHQKQSQ